MMMRLHRSLVVVMCLLGDRMKGLMSSLCAVITGLALLAKAVAMALIASSPKSPRSSLVSLRSVMSLLVSPKMLLQWVVNSGELGVMILEFASSSFGSALIRKSLKWLSRHLVRHV